VVLFIDKNFPGEYDFQDRTFSKTEMGYYVFHIIGLGLLMLWSFGLLTPFTIIGFLEILILTLLLNLLLKKILKMNFNKVKQNKRAIIEINLNEQP
jgi:predicted membrane protein